MSTEPKRERLTPETMTPEQRAAVEAIRARHRTPESRAEEQRVRVLARRDFPPATEQGELAPLVSALKAERYHQGLSTTDVAERTGMDRATVSKVENGRLENPTMRTLQGYARGLGLRIEWSLVPLAPPKDRTDA